MYETYTKNNKIYEIYAIRHLLSHPTNYHYN